MTTPYIFTQDSAAFFAGCRRNGLTFMQACKAFGWNHQTVRKYAEQYGFGAELRLIYPPSRTLPFPKKKRNPAAEWLSKPWRVAA